MKILIAASGTGGHLLPALCIAQAILDENPHIQIEFVGSGRPLEQTIIGNAGFILHKLSVVGVRNRGIKGLFQFLSSIPSAINQVRALFKEVKPDLVIGVGGYVSVFPVIWARLLGIPSLIHEAEVKPGWANLFLSFFVSKFSAAFKETRILFQSKLFHAGHPLRKSLMKMRSSEIILEDPRKIFITGGSQGSKYIDDNVPTLLSELNNPNLEILHQCRSGSEDELIKRYKELNLTAKVVSFIEKIDEAYRWCEVIISRSGAGALREIEILNKPTIFIPLPYSLEQHENAEILVKVGKALLVEEGDNFRQGLKQMLNQLLDRQTYNKIKQIPYQSPNVDASQRIAKVCMDLLESKPNIP